MLSEEEVGYMAEVIPHESHFNQVRTFPISHLSCYCWRTLAKQKKVTMRADITQQEEKKAWIRMWRGKAPDRGMRNISVGFVLSEAAVGAGG